MVFDLKSIEGSVPP